MLLRPRFSAHTALLWLGPAAILLIGASGLSYEEAAQICGCAVGTIKSRVNRARSKLSALLYVDGADESNRFLHLVKGGGGALTREKIIASMAKQFICICDSSKQVPVLGGFALPVEIIPLARGVVTRELEKLGGQVSLRPAKSTRTDLNQTPSEPFVTDNGGWILDVAGLKIADPIQMESQINQIAGVITVGLFAKEKANVLLVSNASGVNRITF